MPSFEEIHSRDILGKTYEQQSPGVLQEARLFLRKVLGALENSPAAICQKILLSGRLEFGNLQAPNLIDGLSVE